MKIKISCSLLSLIVLLVLGGAASAATPKLTISSTGNGVFTISGSSMDGVDGMDVTITYNQSTLSNPQVTLGPLVSNSMIKNFNTKIMGKPDTIKLVTATTTSYRGSGVIATINFDRLAGSPGIITSLGAELVINNTLVKAVTLVSNPSEFINTGSGSSTDTGSGSSTDTGSGGGSGSSDQPNPPTTTSGWLGTVTMPPDAPPAAEHKEPAPQTEAAATAQTETRTAEPAVETQQAAAGEEKKQPVKEQFVSHLSMIERFKRYNGERTPSKLLALLREPGKGYLQDPPVFLPDGKATVMVIFTLPPDTTVAPNVAISKEGQMVSFRRGEDGSWLVEIRPKKDADRVTLTYFIENQVTEIPLTVARRLDTFKGKPFAKLTEADFVQFIAGRDAAKELQPFDINGDKALNHIDDFIFSANYLVQAPPLKAAGEKTPAKPAKDLPATKQEGGKPAAGSTGKP